MSQQNDVWRAVGSSPPVVLEFGIVTALLAVVALWRALATDVVAVASEWVPSGAGVLSGGLVGGGVLLAGLAGVAAAYTRFRGVDVGTRLPSRDAAPMVGLAALTPVVGVSVSRLLAAVTGVPFTSLTKTSVAGDVPLAPLLVVAGLGVLVGVPALVLTCQVLVQASFGQVVGADTAVGLTTAVAGLALVSDTGGLAVAPAFGRLVGVVAVALALGLAASALGRFDDDRLRYLGTVPLVVVAASVALAGIVAVETLAGGAYAVTQLAVLGVAAYTYDRTRSLLVPALAYASLLLTTRAVVLAVETGVQGW